MEVNAFPVVVHIAGAIEGGTLQRCARCGIVLYDLEGVTVSSGIFWAPGEFVGVCGAARAGRLSDATGPESRCVISKRGAA